MPGKESGRSYRQRVRRAGAVWLAISFLALVLGIYFYVAEGAWPVLLIASVMLVTAVLQLWLIRSQHHNRP